MYYLLLYLYALYRIFSEKKRYSNKFSIYSTAIFLNFCLCVGFPELKILAEYMQSFIWTILLRELLIRRKPSANSRPYFLQFIFLFLFLSYHFNFFSFFLFFLHNFFFFPVAFVLFPVA